MSTQRSYFSHLQNTQNSIKHIVVTGQKVSLQVVITALMLLNVKIFSDRDFVVPYSSLDSDYISCLSSLRDKTNQNNLLFNKIICYSLKLMSNW